jgi:uncharacterized protein YbaA (DUF1428 family)
MYNVIYIYPVPEKNIREFLRIQSEVVKIYLRYGTISDQTFYLDNPESKYGCLPFTKALTLEKGEQAYLSITAFRSSSHYDEVMKKVDADSEIDKLYSEIEKVIDVIRVIRGEFVIAD